MGNSPKNLPIVINGLEIPFNFQDDILPAILRWIPDSAPCLGLDWDTYWTFPSKTRRQFLIRSLENSSPAPTGKQLAKIFKKETKRAKDGK